MMVRYRSGLLRPRQSRKNMAFRRDRLQAMLQVKKVDRPDLQRRTRISSDQMGRILTGERKPGDTKIAAIVVALEVDADYLLDTDARYDPPMSDLVAAALMALDRYLSGLTRDDQAASPRDVAALRRLALEHSEPPLWIAEWGKQHESMRLIGGVVEAPAPAPKRDRPRRGRPARPS